MKNGHLVTVGQLLWRHDERSAKLDDALRGGRDVVHLDENLDEVMRFWRGRPDPAVNAALGTGIHDAVAHRVVCVDFPAEQSGVESLQLLGLAGYDLPRHHGLSHL